MNIQHYKQRLLEMEADLSARTDRVAERGRDETVDSASDVAEAGVADEAASEDFAEVDRDAALLTQVRDALKRIEDGTFGQCVVDGGPIEAKRLEASPWTPRCLNHQAQFEADARPES